MDSKHKHTIEKSSDGKNSMYFKTDANAQKEGVGSSSTISFNADQSLMSPEGGWSSSTSSLAHELLGHSWEGDKGLLNKGKTSNGITYAEVSAVNIQNIILQGTRMPMRTQTQVNVNGKPENRTIPSDLLNNYFSGGRK